MRWNALLAVVFVVVGCGDNRKAPGDAGIPDGPVAAVCGNYKVEPGEDCDDGDQITDAICDSNCHFTCGNGHVDDAVGEACDTAIAAGLDGACPATCDDGQDCTTDVLVGSDCTATCIATAITEPGDGDGCCPTGANANNDNDCTAVCGNGIVEAGELCDTGITSGAGACPVSCDDSQSCTTDTLINASSCQAACTHQAITMPHDGDGCCPKGATSANDSDCLPGCGNGVLDPGETCDTAITTGVGACPTACSDGMACTTDILSNAGTCTAACVFPAITMAVNGDGCCPPGANANTDNDCMPVCGNHVVEGTEECDDGNTTSGDGCSSTCKREPTAYRFTDLDLRDPHAYVAVSILCLDVTDMEIGTFSVNNEIQTAIQTDGTMPPDGLLDLSPTVVFRPLTQTNGATTAIDFYFADCTAPMATTSCHPGATAPNHLTATIASTGTCLAPIVGTTRPYTPSITSSTGPCYSSTTTTVTVTLAGIPITLTDAQIAATFVGAPATSTVNGLLRGFISEADANATTLPASLPIVGGQPLSSLLAGGTGSCASGDDRDFDGSVRGWWFYMNFTAARVPWTEP
jgi:cysteine-rich repeat protein